MAATSSLPPYPAIETLAAPGTGSPAVTTRSAHYCDSRRSLRRRRFAQIPHCWPTCSRRPIRSACHCSPGYVLRPINHMRIRFYTSHSPENAAAGGVIRQRGKSIPVFLVRLEGENGLQSIAGCYVADGLFVLSLNLSYCLFRHTVAEIAPVAYQACYRMRSCCYSGFALIGKSRNLIQYDRNDRDSKCTLFHHAPRFTQ